MQRCGLQNVAALAVLCAIALVHGFSIVDAFVTARKFTLAIDRKWAWLYVRLYFFGLIGLVMGILGDVMYTVVDPRIDFESRS